MQALRFVFAVAAWRHWSPADRSLACSLGRNFCTAAVLLEVNSETVPGSENYPTTCDKCLAVILKDVMSETVLGSESSATTCDFQSCLLWMGMWCGKFGPAVSAGGDIDHDRQEHRKVGVRLCSEPIKGTDPRILEAGPGPGILGWLLFMNCIEIQS